MLACVFAQLPIANHTKLSMTNASAWTTHARPLVPLEKVAAPPKKTSLPRFSQNVPVLLLMVKTHAMPSTVDFSPLVSMALLAHLATLVKVAKAVMT